MQSQTCAVSAERGYGMGCAYIELFVKDRVAMINYFTKGFDFVEVAEAALNDRHSTLLCSGEIQLVITVPADDQSPVANWLVQHGEGIADIALYRQDVTQTATSAMLSGLPVYSPVHRSGEGYFTTTIGGVGSLRHTLIDPAGAAGPVPPPGRLWRRLEPSNARTRHLENVDHVDICIEPATIAEVVGLYRALFGLDVYYRRQVKLGVNRYEMQAMQGRGRFSFVFLEPEKHAGSVADFLKVHQGAGARRLAFSTSQIVEAVCMCDWRGISFDVTPARYYEGLVERMASQPDVLSRLPELRDSGVMVAHDHGGLLWQAMVRSPHIPRAVSYQVIQRDGAQGLGVENLLALKRAQDADLKAMEDDLK